MAKNQHPLTSPAPLLLYQDFDGGTTPVYVGEAKPGTASSVVGWRIKKLTYSSYKLVNVKWADSGKFTQIWDNRSSLSYS